MSATAFVLAAGFGTRLQPLTRHRPKPLVPVAGVPLLSYALALCARHGHRHVVVNAHHLADQVAAWEGEREGVRVTVSMEDDILGTGGGLRAVQTLLAERFVVLNGDVLHDVDLSRLLAAVPPGGAAMALRPDADHVARYGAVEADAETIVVRLRDHRVDPVGDVRRDMHFTGIHAMSRSALAPVPDEAFADVITAAYAPLIPARRVASLRHEGAWVDAGNPALYLEANRAVLHGELGLALDPFARAAAGQRVDGDRIGVPEGVTLEGPVWIGPGATVGPGTHLARTVVGAGATVAPGSRLVDSVVWDGAAAEGELTSAVVHDGGVLVVQ